MLQDLKFKNYRTIAAVTAIVLFSLSFYFLYLPVYAVNEEFTVNEGDGLSRIAEQLKSENLIKNELFFIFYVKALGLEKELKAGSYIFNGFMSVPRIVSLLAEGFAEGNDVRVFISEGSNIWEIDRVLFNAGLSGKGDFAGKFYRDEGYLFPDTYLIPSQKSIRQSAEKTQNSESATELANKMKNNFKIKTKDILTGLSETKKREIIIIASILEKEARTENDMRLIAGIIEKRIASGMLLQIDATVSYGACQREFKYLNISMFKYCDVSQIGVANEIKTDSEFNTYMRKELPPSPISNPGLKALSAAANPLKSDYLYYLSTRSGDEIIFSKTSEEHAQNRKKYLEL